MANTEYATGWTTRRARAGDQWIPEPLVPHAIGRGAAAEATVKALCGQPVMVMSAGDTWPTSTLRGDAEDCPECTAKASR